MCHPFAPTTITTTGKLLTYLYPDAKGPRKVFAVDLTQPLDEGSYKLFDTAASGGLSLQEQLRRERMRLFTQGIASYEWSNKPKNGQTAAQKLIVPLDGKVILYEDSASAKDASEKCRIVYDGSAGDAVDPHLSPDGTAVAFVIKDDLYAMRISSLGEPETFTPTRLTFNGAKAGVTCGLADYLAQEEMDRFGALLKAVVFWRARFREDLWIAVRTMTPLLTSPLCSSPVTSSDSYHM